MSELGTNEYIQMVASWEYLKRNKQYGCKEKKNLSPEKLEAFQNRNGCNFRITEKPRQTVDIINFHSCFCDHLHDNFGYLLHLHDSYSRGVMPYQGSLSEQPNHIIEVFQLIDKFKQDYEQELRDKQK